MMEAPSQDGFTPKLGNVDWNAVLQLDTSSFINGDVQNDLLLESLYPMLVAAKPRLDGSDPLATPENLYKLFQATQLVLELQHIYVQEDSVKMSQQEAELRRMNSQLAAAESKSGGAAEMRRLEAELSNLEQRNNSAVESLQAAEKALERERAVSKDLTTQRIVDKDRIVELEEEKKRLERDVKELRQQVLAQRTTVTDETLEKRLREKNAEISGYLTEVKLLSDKNEALTKEIAVITSDMEASVRENERMESEVVRARQALEESDKALDTMRKENADLQLRLTDITQQLDDKDNMEDSLLENLQSQIAEWRQKIVELQSELSLKEDQNAELKREVELLRGEMTIKSTDRYRKQLEEKDAYVNELEEKLKTAQKELETLSVEWTRLEKRLQTMDKQTELGEEFSTNTSVRKHMRAATESKAEADRIREMREQDVERVKVIEATLQEKEAELIDLRHRVDLHEKGIYGLKEAMEEISNLKVQRSIRDKNISEMADQINHYSRVTENLLDENGVLREKLGMEKDTQVDLTAIHHKKSVEYEQSKAMNIEYRREIDRLEEERIKLLSQLRLQAMEKGERAVQLGLGAEDLMAVEEFANQLRSGERRRPDPRSEAPLLNNEQLNKLMQNLEHVHHELRISREERMEMEKRLHDIASENNTLHSALQEIAETFVDTQSHTQSSDTTQKQSSKNLAHVQQLLQYLETKTVQAPTTFSPPPRPASANDNLAKVNATLRREISVLREKLAAQKSNARAKEETVNTLQTELVKIQISLKERDDKLQKFTEKENQQVSALIAGDTSNLSLLTEQLVVCMHDLELKETELATARSLLEGTEKRIQDLAAQQQNLYGRYSGEKEEWTKEVENLQRLNESTSDELKIRETKIQNLEQLVESLRAVNTGNPDSDLLKQQITDLTRRNIVSRVNEKILSRRHLAQEEVEKSLRKQLDRASETIHRLESTSVRLIVDLRNHLEVQQLEIAQLRTKVVDTIPKGEFDILESKFDRLNEKYQDALEHSTESAPSVVILNSVQAELRTAKEQTMELELVCNRLRSEAEKFADVAQLHKDLDGMLENSHAPLLTAAYVKKLTSKVAHLHVELENATGKINFLEAKCQHLAETETVLKSQVQDFESKYLSHQSELSKLRDKIADLRQTLLTKASKEDLEAREMEISRLKQECVELRTDLERYRELASVASHQANDLNAKRTEHQKENEILRAAVQELQMQGDEKLVIGKLHQTVLALQVSECLAYRNLEKEVERNRKLEALLIRAEKSAGERDQLLWSIRLDYKTKLYDLQKRFFTWKEQYVIPADDASNPAAIDQVMKASLHRLERLQAATHNMQSKFLQLVQSNTVLQEQKRVLVDEKNKLEIELESARELISLGKSPQTLPQRLENWQKKLAELRQREMKQQRELNETREQVMRLESMNNEYAERIRSLEESTLLSQSEYENSAFQWERRELELEKRLLDFEQQRDAALASATKTLVSISSAYKEFSEAPSSMTSDDFPDPSLSIPAQLEFTLEKLAEKKQLIADLVAKIADLEKSQQTQDGSLKNLEGDLKKKETALLQMQHQLADVKITDNSAAVKDYEKLQLQFEDFQTMSKASIETLQKQLASKELQLLKYQEMLQHAKKLQVEQAEMGRKEIADLRETVESIQLARNKLQRQVESLELQLKSNSEENAPDTVNTVGVPIFTAADMEQAIGDLEKERMHLLATVRRLNEELKIAQLEADKQALDARRSSIETLESNDDENPVKLEDPVEEWKSRCEQLQIALQSNQADLIRLKMTLESKNEDLRLREQKENTLVKALDAVRDEMLKEVTRLSLHRHDDYRHLYRRECSANDLRSEILSLQSKYGKLSDAYRLVEIERDQVREKQETMDRQLSAQEESIEKLRVVLGREQGHVKEKEAMILELQEEITSLMAEDANKIARSHWENEKKLRKLVDGLKKKVTQLSTELEAVIRERDHRQEEERSLVKASEKIRTLELTNAKLRREIRGSKSLLVQSPQDSSTDKLEQDKKLMTLRFELEERNLEIVKLQKRITEFEEATKLGSISRASSTESLHEAFKLASSKDSDLSAENDVERLKLVIDRLSRALLRFQNQKNRTRSSAGSTSKVAGLTKVNKELQKSNAELPDKTEEKDGKFAKLLSDKLFLQRKFKKNEERMKELQEELARVQQEKQSVHDRLAVQLERGKRVESELSHERRNSHERLLEVESLKRELKVLEIESTALQKQKSGGSHVVQKKEQAVGTSPRRNSVIESSDMKRQLEELRTHNQELQKELDAFDPAFFDELEDLKYNYDEAKRKNAQYEEELENLRNSK